MSFQKEEHFVSERRQLVGRAFVLSERRLARQPVHDPSEQTMDLRPIGRCVPCPPRRHAFLDTRRDHLDDVAPAQRHAFARKAICAVVGRHLVLGALILSELLFAAAVLSLVSAVVFTALFGPVLSTGAMLLVAIPFSAAALAGTCAHVWRSLREELTQTLRDLYKKGP